MKFSYLVRYLVNSNNYYNNVLLKQYNICRKSTNNYRIFLKVFQKGMQYVHVNLKQTIPALLYGKTPEWNYQSSITASSDIIFYLLTFNRFNTIKKVWLSGREGLQLLPGHISKFLSSQYVVSM